MKLFLSTSALAFFGPAAGCNVRIRNYNEKNDETPRVIGFKPSTRPAQVRKGDSQDVAFALLDLQGGRPLFTGNVKNERKDEPNYVDLTGIHVVQKGKLGWVDAFSPETAGENDAVILMAHTATRALEILAEDTRLHETLREQLKTAIQPLAEKEREEVAAQVQQLENAQGEPGILPEADLQGAHEGTRRMSKKVAKALAAQAKALEEQQAAAA